MGMVMVKCPQTGRSIPTGIKTDRESFRRSPVFFERTHCPICHTDHAWFARDAWVDEPNAWARRGAPSRGPSANEQPVHQSICGSMDEHYFDLAERAASDTFSR